MIPRPQYFIVRPGLEQITPAGQVLVEPGICVPMIPADLLPEWLEVVGVPRSLPPEHTAGMMNLGTHHTETETYQLKFAPIHDKPKDHQGEEAEESAMSSASTQTDSAAEQAATAHDEGNETKSPTERETATPKPKCPPKPQTGLASSRHNPANCPPADLPGSYPPSTTKASRCDTASNSSAQTAASPCRHWCHYGACRWGVSCRFEHSMPTTASGLAEVGLAEFPTWWLQSTGMMPMAPGAIRMAESRRAAKKNKNKNKNKKQGVVFPRAVVGAPGRTSTQERLGVECMKSPSMVCEVSDSDAEEHVEEEKLIDI